MRRAKGYQDLDDNAVGPRLPAPPMPPPQEIEMASVSVVPDDTFTVTQAVNALGFGWFQVKLSLCTGLCWMADSMEMTILSILSPALHCEWNISNCQKPSDVYIHTGQKWNSNDYRMARFNLAPKLVNNAWAVKLISEIPPKEIPDRVVWCDGGSGAEGHPKIYINLDRPGVNTCGYCGLRFIKKECK